MTTTSDLARIAAAALASRTVPVTVLPAGVASAPNHAPSRYADDRRRNEPRNRITLVVDHAGREHAKNADGEWLW